MSLLNSIFGEAPATGASPGKQKETAPDLFGQKLSVPTILHKKTAYPKKGRKNKDATIVADKPTEETKSSTSDEDQSPTSDSASQQPTSEDVPTDNSTVKTKKTQEQLKEEEERTIFVGNLPPDISKRTMAGIFKLCGKVASARFRSMAVSGVKLPPDQAGNQNMMRKVCANTGKIESKTPKKSAQGYVVFESIESIEKALQMNNTTYESRIIRVDHASPTIEPSRSVFVGNLPYGTDEETLRDHFLKQLSEGEDLNESEGSAVSGVRVIRDKETQKCKGFGYVMLRDATLVPLALQLHGTTYKKKELRVNICGKRFKGNRGDESKSTKSGRRGFEGQRATGASRRALEGQLAIEAASSSTKQPPKRKSEAVASSSAGGNGGGKPKKRRARSEKKDGPGPKSGMSKRAATEQKVKKRVKKLEKRATKGMGKKNN